MNAKFIGFLGKIFVLLRWKGLDFCDLENFKDGEC